MRSYHVATLSATWKFGAMHYYRGSTLQIDNCRLSYLCDALKAQVIHCLTKKALTLRSGVEFRRIIYQWKVYSIYHVTGSQNYGNTTCIRMNSYFKASSNILEMIFKLRKSTSITFSALNIFILVQYLS